MKIQRTSRALALGAAAGCALLAACAGAAAPDVSSDLANEIRAAFETDAGTAGGGGSSAASSAGGSGGSSAAPAPSAGATGSGGSAGQAGAAGSGGNSTSEGGAGGGSAAAGAGGAAGAASRCDGFAILAANCGTSGCHGAGSNLETFAASETAARSFVGKPGTLACGGQGLVIDPEDPEESLMIRKLSDDPPCGQAMPLSGSLLSDSEVRCIQEWIEGL